jgi:glycerophosphoryl diester phosphodiesterase
MKPVCFLPLLLSLATAAQAAPPIIIAHRGASGYLPEHTLPAKALAFGMGADFLEQDLVLSKDGVPVVLHDIYLDTVTDVAKRFAGRARPDGRYYAIDFTLAELRQLKVTERFNAKTGEPVFKGRFPLWQASFSISTFEEELEFIAGLNQSTGRDVGIYPEIKAPAWHRKEGQDISAVVLPILARHAYRTKTDNFWLQCFEFQEVKRLREELGFRGRLVLLLGKSMAGESAVEDGGKKSGAPTLEEVARVADGIGPALGAVVTGRSDGAPQITDLIRRAHALKLQVHPYTVRADELPRYVTSVEELFRMVLVDAGADGVFTDFPDRGHAFVQSLNQSSTR